MKKILINLTIFIFSVILLLIPSLVIFNTPNKAYQGLDIELKNTNQIKLEKILKDNVDKNIRVYSLGINTNKYRIAKDVLEESNLSKLSIALRKNFNKDFSKNDIVNYDQKGDLKNIRLYLIYATISLVLIVVETWLIGLRKEN